MARITKYVHVLFNESLIQLLHENNIYTVQDFLEIELEKIVSITNLCYKDVYATRKSLLNKYSALLINGQDYYKNYVKNAAIIPTGISSMDKLLEGGMLTGNILEICGFSCSGKTQFCHLTAVNATHNMDLQVLYIDAKNDFSIAHIKSIIKERKCIDKMTDILQRIKVYKPRDIHDCLAMLHNLDNEVHKGLRLIIIDSLPALFLPFQGEKKFSNHMMNHLVNIMRYIGTKQHVAFLIINLATRWIETENAEEIPEHNFYKQTITPALGKYWQSVPSVRLLFQVKENNPGFVNVSVLKGSNFIAGNSCDIQMKI